MVAALKRQGYEIALLSGDRKGVVETIADDAGIGQWRAELKPADKIAWLEARASRAARC